MKLWLLARANGDCLIHYRALLRVTVGSSVQAVPLLPVLSGDLLHLKKKQSPGLGMLVAIEEEHKRNTIGTTC